MNSKFFDKVKAIIAADKPSKKDSAKSVTVVLDEMQKNQVAIDKQKQKVKDDISRGTKLTKHRISL
ncbi:hypothetical protein UNDKW_1647 [Undibacterium sp. KW1]|uniref:hypothetical protein n=1 Tax=Undibacterium sp. KW1 TaxID=2058624 RepID=UPI001331D504|nr:hypothetical protein [Undibacterium sp. KW1]BBB59920.1 hypothetical protein UNDKW_1647 [Undibacterium sp. KW1]